ncbi:unnamed protein product, partial [Nesidiocoris tenuis]
HIHVMKLDPVKVTRIVTLRPLHRLNPNGPNCLIFLTEHPRTLNRWLETYSRWSVPGSKKQILKNVSGRFRSGHLNAILGPSGAGKTCLLNAISGYKTSGVSGVMKTNGQPRDERKFRQNSCYITQEDLLVPMLSLHELMTFAAKLKLPPTFTGKQRRAVVRGLDNVTCSNLLKLLRNLAHQGRTIICTIHQPSASLFELFDHVFFLSAGVCIYQGATNQLVPFLSSVDLPCPTTYNPADYSEYSTSQKLSKF